MTTALDRSIFERLVTSSREGRRPIAGLRFGTPQVMRLLAALGCAGLTFKAFPHAELRTLLVDRLGAEPAEVTAARVSYQLTKLHGKGLLREVPGCNRYTLTDRGYRVAVYCTKLHERLLSPMLDSLDPVVAPALVASQHRVDRALLDLNTHLNTHFDHLADVVGLKVAA